MEITNKNDFIDVYVLGTLKEIKNKVKQNIKLKSELEKQTDEKMKLVLKDLINSNFKNLQINTQGNLIYTLLPIVDERENKKVRTSLVLYYTALYYDNVDLLQQMLDANVKFEKNYLLRLQYLDKSISSKFDTKDYIEKIKRFGEIFVNFDKSIKNLSDEEKEKYSQKFSSLFKLKYREMCKRQKEYKGYSEYMLENLFVKGNLDTFEYNTYKYADNKQLELINFCNGHQYNEATTAKLNYLIQNTNFSNRLEDFDLMTSIYSDYELAKLDYDASCFLSYYSETPKMLQKAIEFIELKPEMAFYVKHYVSKEKFMKTSNYVLIETMNQVSKHYLMCNEHNVELLSRIMVPKVTLKRIFGAYKQNNAQEQSDPSLTKKLKPPRNTENK